ncbi:MAG: PIN domain-containing protein [Capsulimonas sp.]|uniref:type II toxin-antitoxin system VapC family toxin n=1 Tax=Capsulimonas sp. TaxID=2494211 RepID=UPI003263351F
MTDILMDAGPLVAIFHRGDDHHTVCTQTMLSLNCEFYTTLPVLTEAMYILMDRAGWRAQEALWRLINRGDLLLSHPSASELVRMEELMSKYNDRPMDFADASLVALAERLSLTKVFTVDRKDFSTYRIGRKTPFTIIGP